MHIKFLARGTGSAAAAAAYLLAKRDAAGTERAAVEVLRGDPIEVARVADGLPFKYLYTSGVIAWSPEDAPSRADVERVLDEFEETAWAGLDRDRYIWSAVLHRDHDGGVHVHILAARCDLATGRSLNVAPPGWQKTFDPLRDAFNYECGWSRPDDPARARPYRPSPHLAYLDAETLRAGWEVEPDRRALVGEHLMRLVAAGAVKDRGGVVAALEGLGFEVPRQGRHYVTILQPATGERLRLKGGLYEADFDRERVMRPVREPSVDREPADRGDDAKRAAEAWGDLEERRLKRAEYHQARYGRGGRVQAAAGDVERESGPVAAAAVERAAVPESLAEHLREELGDEAVVAAVDSMAERDRDLEASRGAAAGDATACLAVLARVGVVDDRDRATADDGVAGVVHAVRAGAEAAGRTDRGLAGAGRGLAETVRSARACGEALDRGIRDAGRDLWRALSTRVAGLEEAVCATSKGEPWLVEAQEAVLEGADRRLTLAARARAVKTVEGRLRAELADSEEALRATSAGAVMLREEYGEHIVSAARLQSFASREDVLARIEARVDAELEAQEEALRSIPLGKQYLSEAEQARAGGAEEQPPPLAERESMVHTVTDRVEAEFDKREERLAGVAGNENLLVEVAGDLGMDSGTLTLGERWRAIESAERWVEAERAEFEAREAAILEDPAGVVFLSDARREILGDADREANTLADRGRVIQAAAAALQKAAAKRQADQEWEKEKTARERALARRHGGLDLYHAHLADLDPKWSLTENTPPSREHDEAALAAAESDDTRLKRLDAVLSDEADAARYQEVLDQAVGQFKTSDLDNALAAGEKARAERETQQWEEKRDALVKELRALPGGMNLYHAHLANLDPKWDRKRNRTSSRENIDAALAAAKSDAPRLDRLRDVLSDEADAARYQEVLDQVAGQFKMSDLDSALTAAEQAREDREWEKQRNGRVDALANLPGGLELYHAHLADLDPQWGVNENTTTTRENIDAALTATESDGARQKRLRVVRSDEAATACYREVLGQVAGQVKMSDLDRALAAGEREQQRAAAERRREAERRAHVGKREEALRATSLGGRWLAEAHQKARDGADRELALVVRERIADTVESRFASDLARREVSLAATASGMALLRKEYGEAGIADPPRSFLRRERVVEQGEWEAKRDARFEALGKQPGGTDLFHAHLADLDPAWDRNRNNTTTRENIDAALTDAESDGRRQERLRAVLSDEAAAARYREVLDATSRQFTTADLDSALAASRLERLFTSPGAGEVFIAALDERAPSWRRTGTRPMNIDRALDVAERELGCEEKAPWHGLVLAAERQFQPSATTWSSAGDGLRRDTDTDRHARSVSQTLSDRARARVLAADGPAAEPEPSPNLVRQVIDWLRTQVELQQLAALSARTGAARLDQRNRNSVRPVVSPPVPKPARLVPDATWQDAELVSGAITDLAERTKHDRLRQRNRNSMRPVSEKSPPVRKLPRRVPDATREDAEREQKQRRRQERLSRVEQALSDPAAASAFVAVLDAQKPAWRTGASPADIDQALAAAEGSLGGGKPSRQFDLVLETERVIPDAPSTACLGAGRRFDRTTKVGREGWFISQTLSDRALARAFAAEKPEPPPPRNVVERLFDWLRAQLEKLFRSSGPTVPAGAGASAAEDQPRLTMAERYSQQWPEHADDIHRLDFKALAGDAEARNGFFERMHLHSSEWTTPEPKELPIALAKPAPTWTDEAVGIVTRAATPGVGPERASHQQIVDAHLGHYEYHLPEAYLYSAEWRAIRERAERAIMDLQEAWRYKLAKKDRKKRKLESTAINSACGRDARRLHEKMKAERETKLPSWEVTVRIRKIRQIIQNERRAREQEHEAPDYRSGLQEPSRPTKPTRDRGLGR